MVKITGTKTPSWNSLSPNECSRGRGIGLLLPFSSNIQWIMSFISMHDNVWTSSGGLRTVSTGGWRESHQALWSTHRHTSSWQPPAFSPLPGRLTPRPAPDPGHFNQWNHLGNWAINWGSSILEWHCKECWRSIIKQFAATIQGRAVLQFETVITVYINFN